MDAILSRVFSASQIALGWQFLRFGSVGFVGFLVDTAVVYGTRGWIGLYWSGLLSYLFAATCTWGLNRIWTFRGIGSGPLYRQWLAFLAANGLGFVLNRGAYVLLVTFSATCAAHPVLAILAGIVAGMFVNFHLSRKVVFR